MKPYDALRDTVSRGYRYKETETETETQEREKDRDQRHRPRLESETAQLRTVSTSPCEGRRLPLSKPFSVSIEPGQFAICFDDGCGMYGGRSVSEEVASLACGTVNDWQPHSLHVVRVDRVMPKTFEGSEFWQVRNSFVASRRRYRDMVIHAVPTLSEAIILRARILGIGLEADRAIEAELMPKAKAINAKHRSKAMTKLAALLPNLIGEAA